MATTTAAIAPPKVTAGHNNLPHPPQLAQGKDTPYNRENKNGPRDVVDDVSWAAGKFFHLHNH